VTVDSVHTQLVFEMASATEPNVCATARTWLTRGQLLHQQNSAEEIAYYQKAIALCPDLVEAYYCLGAVYYAQKDYQQAIDAHLKIIQLQPDDLQAHYRLGVLYLIERRFPQARNAFQKVLAMNPNHQQAREYFEQIKNYTP
jgi:tetratricopeptide (TPR) repeat protein